MAKQDRSPRLKRARRDSGVGATGFESDTNDDTVSTQTPDYSGANTNNNNISSTNGSPLPEESSITFSRKLSDLLLDSEFPLPPVIQSTASGSSQSSKEKSHHTSSNGTTVSSSSNDSSNVFSRIMIPKNVVPRLLRMLQDNLQGGKKKDSSLKNLTPVSYNERLLPRMVVFASHISAADKVYRLVEYILRLIAYLSYLRFSSVTARKALNLASALNDTRAGMRLVGLLMVADRAYQHWPNTTRSRHHNSNSSNNNNNLNGNISTNNNSSHHKPNIENSVVMGESMTSNGGQSSLSSSMSMTASMSSSTMSQPLYTTSSTGITDSPSNLSRDDRMLRGLEAWQTIVLAIYYPLDHIRWFARHGAMAMPSTQSTRTLSRYASACWTTYLLLDLVSNTINLARSSRSVSMVQKQGTLLQLAREHTSHRHHRVASPERVNNSNNINGRSHSTHSQHGSNTVDVSEEQAMLNRELHMYLVQRADWFWRLMSNLGDLPLAVDATLLNPVLPHGLSALLGCCSSAVAIYCRWNHIHSVADTL
ncbi:hypothetical protein SmJEL517_g05983 [Synchytrium microbalum]|uniref:Uncharacterized protein n=1 Tax=Synchytrium microbalum TaxID=1806994 RepID=A0A507BKZ8_9FUNG|nr:uncharacterized protein SmJEL517_g05983 [Synchytrium microbalum]TPX30457.1 hypothetical protein SmJEL517_g05983 [Synchytrium microbalum]